MLWQDIVIVAINIIFTFSLLNQVISSWKSKTNTISAYTSLPTGIGLIIMAYTFSTIGLLVSSFFVGFGGLLWLILFYQSRLYTKKELIS